MDNSLLRIETSEKNDILVIKLIGEVNTLTAFSLDEKIQAYFLAHKYKFIFDLSEMPFISSAGIGYLLAALNQAKKNGGNLKLACPQKDVMDSLKNLEFTAFFQIKDNISEALENF
jgi:anti-anti-sigma factor